MFTLCSLICTDFTSKDILYLKIIFSIKLSKEDKSNSFINKLSRNKEKAWKEKEILIIKKNGGNVKYWSECIKRIKCIESNGIIKN